MTALLNIGLNVGDRVAALTPLDTLLAIRRFGRRALREAVVESDTEPTLVVEVDVPFSGHALYALATTLGQGAIAQWDGQRGILEGPRAAAWGAYRTPHGEPFDPAFFFTLDGVRLAEPAAAIAA